jgi:hypothetical protein
MKRKVDIDKLLEEVQDYTVEYWNGGLLHNTSMMVARGEGRAYHKFDELWMACHGDRVDNVSSVVLKSGSIPMTEYKIERVW